MLLNRVCLFEIFSQVTAELVDRIGCVGLLVDLVLRVCSLHGRAKQFGLPLCLLELFAQQVIVGLILSERQLVAVRLTA